MTTQVSGPQIGLAAGDVPASEAEGAGPELSGWTRVAAWLGAAGLIYLLVCAVSIMGRGFRSLSEDAARSLFAFADRPLVALAVGVLVTVLIQSSTTKTAITVAAVGTGALTLRHSIPLILGANIGTTVTCTIVALGFAKEPEKFRRAFTGAGISDWFNVLAVAIFLPLEIWFHLLERASRALANLLYGAGSSDLSSFDPVRTLTRPVVTAVSSVTGRLSDTLGPLVMIMFGVLLILVVVRYLGNVLKLLMIGRAREWLQAAVGRNDAVAMAAGTGATIITQSSTVTNTVLVPFVGVGALTPRQLYPLTLGAGLGTTLTSVLAAFAVTGGSAKIGLQAAFVHVLFNVFAILVIFGIPVLRPIPLRCAEAVANVATRHKWFAGVYIVALFLLLPALIIALYAIL
jgi:solute carrier family 34 (sodium-dependent phosphate cotransporter)